MAKHEKIDERFLGVLRPIIQKNIDRSYIEGSISVEGIIALAMIVSTREKQLRERSYDENPSYVDKLLAAKLWLLKVIYKNETDVFQLKGSELKFAQKWLGSRQSHARKVRIGDESKYLGKKSNSGKRNTARDKIKK